jgi:hypothetical protein
VALQLGELYAALKLANIPDERARAAAEEVAGYENRLNQIARDLTVLKWMVASNIGLTLLQLSALSAVLFRLVMAS